MNKHLNFKTNYFFPTPSRYLGYLITLIGILGVFSRGFETLFISLIGVGLSFTRLGVLIDNENGKFKEYTSVFWLKIGKWDSLKTYPYLTVLQISEKNTMYSRANVEHSSRNMVYRITLLNKNHYSKILLKQLNNKELAHKEALNIAETIKVEKVAYSPG